VGGYSDSEGGEAHPLFPEGGKRTTITTREEASDLFDQLLSSPPHAVGFDMEWCWLPVRRKQRRTALIQVTFDDAGGEAQCYLVHLAAFSGWKNSKMKKLPPSLLRLLYSTQIEKRGVNLSGDLKKLARDFDVDMSMCRGCVDLEKLMEEEVPELPKKRWGLAAFSSLVLDHEVPK
jgi:hypothetical protein